MLTEMPDGISEEYDEIRMRVQLGGKTMCHEKLATTNILILGKSGAGKSTLVNYLYGQEVALAKAGRPVTARGLHPHHPFMFRNMEIVVWDSWGLEPDKAGEWLKNLKDELARTGRNPDVKDWIHTVIYCYDAKQSRLDDFERTHILDGIIAEGYPLIFAMTKWGLCSEAEKKAAHEVLETSYPDAPRIEIESVSKKLRNGRVTATAGRKELFQEICQNLRKNLFQHLISNMRSSMAQALEEAKRSSMEYFDDEAGFFTVYSEELIGKLNRHTADCYKSRCQEVYRIFEENLLQINNLCKNVIEGYTGLDLKKCGIEFASLMADDLLTPDDAWDGSFAEFVSTTGPHILKNVLLSFFGPVGLSLMFWGKSRKDLYRDKYAEALGRLHWEVTLRLVHFFVFIERVDAVVRDRLNQLIRGDDTIQW